MAIGLKQGRADTMEEMPGNLAVAREFRRRFEVEMRAIRCRELTGLDLSTEEGLQRLVLAIPTNPISTIKNSDPRRR